MARAVNVSTWWTEVDRLPQQLHEMNLTTPRGTPGDDHLHGRRAPETIKGLDGNDVINGRGGDDTLDGGNGDDLLKGSTGADTLSGGAGDDRLYGGTEAQEVGAGRDLLDGGSGDDRLYGGFEEDSLTGGAGKDRFTYLAVSDSNLDHPDIVLDFEEGKDRFVFGGALRKMGDLHFVGSADFSHTPGEVRSVESGDHTSIFADFDGDGNGDFGILVIGEVHLQASDFSF